MLDYKERLERIKTIVKIISDSMEPKNMGFGIMSHPLITSEVFFNDEGGLEMLKTQQQKNNILTKHYEILDRMDNIESVLFYISKPYRMQVLEIIKSLLPIEEFSYFLGRIWVSTEFPNHEKINILVGMFLDADKKFLMTAEDLNFLEKQPDKILVFRGIQPKAKVRALSWTLDYKKAKWFAHRFGKGGEVYSAVVNKEDIFMYNSGRGEAEVVLNPYKLKMINKVDESKYEVDVNEVSGGKFK